MFYNHVIKKQAHTNVNFLIALAQSLAWYSHSLRTMNLHVIILEIYLKEEIVISFYKLTIKLTILWNSYFVRTISVFPSNEWLFTTSSLTLCWSGFMWSFKGNQVIKYQISDFECHIWDLWDYSRFDSYFFVIVTSTSSYVTFSPICFLYFCACTHSVLCVFRLEMKAPGESVCQGVCLADRWLTGWFCEEIPLWSQLERRKSDSEGESSGRHCPSHLMERWSGTRARLIRLCFCAHSCEHTHRIVQQIKWGAGCERPESECKGCWVGA